MCQAGAGAANALLKTLEEPGENTIFLLITHKLDRVLPTIQSRCVKINFEPLKEAELKQILGTDSAHTSMAGGSVTNALILASLPVNELINALGRRDMATVGSIVLGLTDKEQFASVLGVLQSWFLTQYKIDLAPKRAFFIQYINRTLKNLDYNVNMPIMLLDFFTKLEEAAAT
jgi:DNA polymerase-3 subunit delta'